MLTSIATKIGCLMPAKLTQLTYLNLPHNQLTDVKGLENLTQLTGWISLAIN